MLLALCLCYLPLSLNRDLVVLPAAVGNTCLEDPHIIHRQRQLKS